MPKIADNLEGKRGITMKKMVIPCVLVPGFGGKHSGCSLPPGPGW